MKFLTDQSVRPDADEKMPWEEPEQPTVVTVEAESVEDVQGSEEDAEPVAECIQMFVTLEGSSCIRLDSLGGGKIQLAFSDTQAEEAIRLGKYRRMNILATFIPSSKQMDKRPKKKT